MSKFALQRQELKEARLRIRENDPDLRKNNGQKTLTVLTQDDE
jgi:hypothetical protein